MWHWVGRASKFPLLRASGPQRPLIKNGGKASPPVRVLVSGPEKSLAPPLCLWDNSSPDLLRNEVLQWCGRQWCGMGHGSPGDLSASFCLSRTVQKVLVFRPFGNRDN